jgi:peptidoglycan/xylan/chitin deacetylase (PgdA/CDA1 family)
VAAEGQEPERDERRRQGRRDALLRRRIERRRLIAGGAIGAGLVAAVLLVIAGSGGADTDGARTGASAPDRPSALERSRAGRERQEQAIGRVLSYTRFIHEGRPRRRQVALTFDDGPSRYTRAILRILRRHDVPATFFVLGNMVGERPGLVRRELRDGHAVGGHTFDHPRMGLLGLADQIGELNDLDQAMEDNGLPRPRLFRPPYASFNADTIELLDHRRLLMVLWSVDTGDYLDPGSEVIAERALEGAEPGSVILLHDGGGDRSETIDALPAIIRGLERKRLAPVTVPELLVSDPPPREQSLEQLSGIATETEAPPAPLTP